MLRYRFKTLDRKPRPRSQSYIGPTTVGPDNTTVLAVLANCMVYVEDVFYNSVNNEVMLPKKKKKKKKLMHVQRTLLIS